MAGPLLVKRLHDLPTDFSAQERGTINSKLCKVITMNGRKESAWTHLTDRAKGIHIYVEVKVSSLNAENDYYL